jgi:hypothetical protein
MSNLKDTDFDDLFRRASDKYPLRTDSSDWDRMAAALEKDPSPDTPDDADNTDKRRRRRFFWWFLLLPLAGIGYYVTHNGGHGTVAPNSTSENGVAITKPSAASKNDAASTTPDTNPTDTNPTDTKPTDPKATDPKTTDAKATEAKTPDTKATDTKTTDNTSRNTTPNTPSGDAAGAGKTADTKHNDEPVATTTAPALSGGQAGAGMPRKAPRTVNSMNPKSSSKIIRSAGEDVPVRPRTEAEQSRFGDGQISSSRTASTDPKANPVAASFTLHTLNRAPLTGPYALNVNVNAPETKAAVKKDSTKQKQNKKGYLYAGLLAAPDLSTVKFQSTKGVGTTFGVLIGYAFGPHWAVETGAYVDRKRYYTEGEYFDTKKVYMPPNSYLENVDGTCYMWEIPLNVRYTFNPEAKTRWFATAGLSTYLMTRENYTYQYKYNTGTYNHSANWDLKKASQYPFSIIGISAGFEQRLGNVGNLRVEPYVRVPLGGVGTGNLPILSTGINIGITRRLWK